MTDRARKNMPAPPPSLTVEAHLGEWLVLIKQHISRRSLSRSSTYSVQSLSKAQLSLRAIAKVLGVDVATVHRSLGARGACGSRWCRGAGADSGPGRQELPTPTPASCHGVLGLR